MICSPKGNYLLKKNLKVFISCKIHFFSEFTNRVKKAVFLDNRYMLFPRFLVLNEIFCKYA